MAILKSALEEPLLSRTQTAVLRNIACATQLNEGLRNVKQIKDTMCVLRPGQTETKSPYSEIEDYLKSEINRVLMQIKVPAYKSLDQQAAPGKQS